MYRFDNKILKGDAVTIVVLMKELVFNHERFDSINGYIDWFVHSVWCFRSIGLSVCGDSTEERCESLVREMVQSGLLIPIE